MRHIFFVRLVWARRGRKSDMERKRAMWRNFPLGSKTFFSAHSVIGVFWVFSPASNLSFTFTLTTKPCLHCFDLIAVVIAIRRGDFFFSLAIATGRKLMFLCPPYHVLIRSIINCVSLVHSGVCFSVASRQLLQFLSSSKSVWWMCKRFFRLLHLSLSHSPASVRFGSFPNWRIG